ncbi:MlaD family protein [Flavobacterium frigidarium]|uniref:MlaD family protein n=1 Tax=Flavobacterium frigidarium TaxID=99286 RepID=UPI000407BC44|nr:MlaD family protein [Flavobacterium frigidarium]
MENKIIKAWKLGMFVALSLTVFLVAIYFIGKSQNLFGTTFHLEAKFKNVSGLQIGNNVQLSGINIGTVKEIEFVSDSIVMVNMVIRSEIQQYIKTDASATIGSDGLMGDKVLMIAAGSASQEIVKDHSLIKSTEAVGMEDLMNGLKKSIDNAEIITKELSEFSYKINNGRGALSKVLTDEEFSKSIDRTLQNLETGTDEFVVFTKKMNDKNGSLSKVMTDPVYARSLKKTLSKFEKSAADINVFTAKLKNDKGIVSKLLSDEKMANDLDSIVTNTRTATEKLNELEEAAKHNFLLRGFFRKKEKAKDKMEANKNH